MNLIPVKNSSYSRYEELLLRRDNLRKEAFLFQRRYTAEFGDRIITVFEKKIECIRLKKTMEYCQAAANFGRSVDPAQLQDYLEQQMAEFQAKLTEMLQDTESAKRAKTISEMDLLEIKKIYRHLAKRMHPDMNSGVAASPELLDLWNRIVVAYHCNQLRELQELEVLANAALERLGGGVSCMDLPDLEEKIAALEEEIRRIRETDPYLYGQLLEDPAAVAAKKEALEAELRSYEDYGRQLEEMLQNLMKGVRFTWRMN